MTAVRHVKNHSDVAFAKKPIVKVLWMGAALLIALRLFFWLSGTSLPDEAYYWMWSQHPAISYYDHPPLNAWAMWVSSKLFGWNIFALRIVPILTFIADIWLLWSISNLLSEKPKQHFFVTLILFLSTPIFLTMSMLALPDHLLILFLLLSLFFFLKFFSPKKTTTAWQWSSLYLACVFLGFATLAKYNAVLFGAGIFIFAITNARARTIFSHWQSYFAFALFLAVVSPEIYWNIATKASSVTFVLQDRHAGLPTDNNFDGVKGYVGGMVAFLSPFLIWPLLQTLFGRRTTLHGDGIKLARAIFWASSLLFLTLSLTTEIMFHWNLVAYVAILPFIALYMRAGWTLIAHSLFGILVAGLIAFNFSVLPLRTYFSSADYFSARAYGWQQTAQKAQVFLAKNDIGFIAGTHYTISAPLGFALKNPDVTDLGPLRSQYRYWFEPTKYLGQNALIVTETANGLSSSLASRFETVEHLDSLRIEQNGYLVEERHFYLASGFKG